MIIYQVTPNRAFPYIISALLGENYTTKTNIFFDRNIQHFKYSFEFSEIFDVAELEDLERMYAYQTEVIRFHPDKDIPRRFKDVHHPKYYKFTRFNQKEIEMLDQKDLNRDLDIVHGLFSSNRLKNFKKPDDFSFVFLDDPIQSVYNLYKYTYYVYDLGIKEFKENYYYSENNIPSLDFEGRNYIHYYELLKKECTLEKFIDKFIDSGCKWIHNFFYFPTTIYEEGAGRISKIFKDHDFYGIVNTKENLIKSINKFNEYQVFKQRNFRLDANVFSTYFNTSEDQNDSYRREELENLMKEDILFFQEKIKDLNE